VVGLEGVPAVGPSEVRHVVDTGMKGRVVLVTGASSGIGRAIAEAYGAEGARVALTYRSAEASAHATARAVEAAGGESLVLPLELGRIGSCNEAIEAVRERWSGIDGLVANAVQWPERSPEDADGFEQMRVERWRTTLRTNLEGTFATLRAALPAMRGRDGGRIVLMSSGLAEEGMPGGGDYGAAKAGLHGLARSLAWELGREGILVNVVDTGFTLTERNLEHFGDDVRERTARAVPSRRLSTPEEVARLVVFLGSAANGNITGEIVREGSSTAGSAHSSMAA
jgi:NAD(P)-dependent dehydrogenase (short-subunit alcohol dehydrogenase family)